MARATGRPPKPLSKTPMGRSSTAAGYRPARFRPATARRVAAPTLDPMLLPPGGPVLAHGGLSAGADNVATVLVIGAIVTLAWYRIVRRRSPKGERPRWL